MENKYREIEFVAGQTIESAIRELKKHKDLVCGSFNGNILYSDVDDLNSAFIKVTGKTKAEFKEIENKRHIEYKQEKRKHEEAIPELTKDWIKKGNAILDQKYHKLWAELVPIRLKDLYRGYELEASLEVIEQLNNNCEFKKVKTIIEEQGHSGMSFSLVCSMIKVLCDKGSEFVNYVQT